jgi:GLPGLI family protein
MKSIIKYCWLLIISSGVKAQNNQLLYTGKVEFEKRTNVHATVDNMMKLDPGLQRELDGLKTAFEQFYTETFTLYFNKTTTLYKQTSDGGKMPLMFLKKLVVYSNLEAGTRLSEKEVRGKKYIISDSVRKIQWRITNETRTIAGFECKRANALLFDSVYVVAFFAGDIVPSGGPDTFNGLPGLILQVNLPHEHVSWTAKTVSLQIDPATEMKPPPANKTTTVPEFNNMIDQLSGNNSVIKQLLIKQLTL